MSSTPQKVLAKIGTQDFQGGGLLNPKQRKEFVTNVVDESRFVKEFGRVVTMAAPIEEIDRLNLGERVMHHAQEQVEPGDDKLVQITSDKITLSTQEYIIIWNESDRIAEDTIEGEGTNRTIAEMIAAQAGNDMEDYALDSDMTSSDASLNKQEGFLRLIQLQAPGSHYVTATGTFGTSVANKMIKAMPTKYRGNRYGDLRFAVSMNQLQNYRNTIAQRETMLGDDQLQSSMVPLIFGIKVIGIPRLDDNLALLTFTNNFIVGFHRDIRRESERKPRKRHTEWTITLRVGFALENADAVVWTDGLSAA